MLHTLLYDFPEILVGCLSCIVLFIAAICLDSRREMSMQRLRTSQKSFYPGMQEMMSSPFGMDSHATSGDSLNDRRTLFRDQKVTAVLMVIDGLFPAVGGAEIQAVKLAKKLKHEGLEVEFLAPLIDPETQEKHTTVDGIDLTRISYPRIKGIGAVVLNLKFVLFLLQNQNRFDAVHFHTMGTLTAFCGFIKPLLKCKVISKVSGYYEFSEGVLNPEASSKLIGSLLQFGIKRIDYVQSISRETCVRLLEFGFSEQQVRYIPNGIETQIVRMDSNKSIDRTIKLGYAGRIRTVKGVHVLIKAFAQLMENNPYRSVVLELAGDGTEMAEVEELAKTLGVHDKIRFHGFVDDVSAFLSRLDIYVQPSFAEGLPNSVLEAMNHSLPIVATDIGGNRDLVIHGYNGYLVLANDDTRLTWALEEILDNPSLLDQFGECSRKLVVEQFDMRSVATELRNLYDAQSFEVLC